uniref:protein LURP-one-related 5-like n=1 Tax=Erigeron canadensis TaxID=72917 RepID=UPI001CB8C588|nr:protein LURP-one-related 5-like [Erigeron canadensis]
MSFQGTDGFTVYDRHGSLAFRVDNYSRNSRSCSSLGANGTGSSSGSKALILMDGSGTPLLTLKPQIFCIQNQWNGFLYNEDHKGFPKSDQKIFMMRRPNSKFVFGQTKNKETQCEAEVFFIHPSKESEAEGGCKEPSRRQPDYRIEGSFWNRNCKIRSTTSGEVAAKIMRKRTTTTTMTSSTLILSEEVFSLVVQPGFDPQIIMAFVIILDRICVKPVFTPLVCS